MDDPERYLSFLSKPCHPTREKKELAYGASAPKSVDSSSSKFFPEPLTPKRPPIDSFESNPFQGLRLPDTTDEYTLDAFDRELLAESADDRQWKASQGLARISLPPKKSTVVPNCQPPTQTPFDRSRLATPGLYQTSSSSPTLPVSSPSIRALKQKEQPSQPGLPRVNPFNRIYSSIEPPRKFEHTQPTTSVSPGDPLKRLELKHAPPIIQGIQLVSPHDLPDRFRAIFPFPIFNAVQSKCFKPAFFADDNLVLSAPTGSGKTVVMELAICRLLHTFQSGQFKVVYQAPTKSLCSERSRDWEKKFAALDLKCAELTGDTDHTHLKSVQSASVIITTPEKWDSVTRKWKDHIRLMQMVKLFLIDEVHILRESRGATLEAVVSRMKSVGSNVRFVALSATVPNPEDVAAWLGKNSTSCHLPAHRERFGEEFRPVQLQKFVYGYPAKSNDFIFDKILESKLPEILARHSNGKPIMIFCSTRASCSATAKSLSVLWESTNPPARLWHKPAKIPLAQDPDLKRTLPTGVAHHHAGLDTADRRVVEESFLAGHISIVCATSTLAVGVNLPCYLVIIKGTVTWASGAMQEYADLEMMQMLGRAGRPQFETSACAVILTRNERVDYYNKMVAGQQCLESCLHLNLIDHLNAEIGLGTVTDLATARKWLAGTFLCVRLGMNPRHYQLQEGLNADDENETLEQICKKDIKLLQEVGLVTRADRMKCTEFGDAMARYYIRFPTMQVIMSIPPKAKMSEILSAMAQAAEFKDAIRFKSGEKSLYKEINKDVGIKFPIKVDIALPAHKVSLLIQAELGGVDFPSNEQLQKHKHAFLTDKNLVFQHVNRLIRCIIDCQLHLEDAVAVRHGLELARSMGAKVWDNSPLQIKQLDQVGNVAVRKLASAGVNSIEMLESTEAHRIELVLGKNPPYGMKLLAKVAEIPKLRVSVKMVGKESRPGKPVAVKIEAEIGFLNDRAPLFFRRRPVFVCFLAEISDGKIIDFRRMSAKGLQKDCEISFDTNLTNPHQFVTCSVMCDEVAGTMRQAILKPDVSAALFPTPVRQKQPNDNRQRQESKTSSGEKPAERQDEEEFDNGGLNDSDLLTAETAVDFMDLDDFSEVAQLANSQTNEETTRKEAQPKRKPKMVPDESWQPTRLENGKYACKHMCKDKTSCTHQCCKNGLDKPPKRPMKPVNENRPGLSCSIVAKQPTESTKTKKLRASSQGKTPLDKANSTLKEKRHSKLKPGAQERKNLTRLHESTGTAATSSTLCHVSPTLAYRDGMQLELSFLGGGDNRKGELKEFDAESGDGVNGDALPRLDDLRKRSDLTGDQGQPSTNADHLRKDKHFSDEGFDLSDEGIFDFEPDDFQGHHVSNSPESHGIKDEVRKGEDIKLWSYKTRCLPLSQESKQSCTFAISEENGTEWDNPADSGPLKSNAKNSKVHSMSQDGGVFLSESSPFKTLPQLDPTPWRTDSSSPFRRVLGQASVQNKRSPSAVRPKAGGDSSASKRRKLRAQDLMLDSEDDDWSAVELKAIPLSNMTKLQNWDEVKQKQREEGEQKAKEYAEAEMERKRREKEELDRETWDMLGPEFEAQFKDLVEFV